LVSNFASSLLLESPEFTTIDDVQEVEGNWWSVAEQNIVILVVVVVVALVVNKVTFTSCLTAVHLIIIQIFLLIFTLYTQ